MCANLKGLIGAVVLVSMTLVLLAGAGCSRGSGGAAVQTMTITDLAGRSVELEGTAAKVCAIGPGALRLVCYVGAAEKVVGIENMEKQWSGGRPYILAYPQLLDLPVIGQGGPDSTPDPEALLTAAPDLIFAAYLVDAAKANELQEKTGIPVVVLSYGQLGTFDRQLLDSILLVGELTGNAGRAEEVVAFIKECEEDLDTRTAGIPDDRKPTVYAGGLGMRGTHGIESTQASFPPFTAINARNVVDETGQKASVMIDKEQLLQWNPDIIFIDESGWQMVREDYAANPGLYTSLEAVQSGKLYGYLPYNYYTTNVDTALADAYFMGTVIYPEAFQDVDAVGKAREIYRFLLGTDVYDRMAADFGGFIKLELTGR
ncbi:MAG: iron ABC transporter substrate-binding protein [Spirochaetales bacterium]|nr:iron ABC transporter substrate-binding protein [Spirochaetales bacterium]